MTLRVLDRRRFCTQLLGACAAAGWAGLPSAPALAATGPHAAVVSQQAGTVCLIDVDKARVAQSFQVPRVPAALAAAPDGRLFVSHPDLGRVSLLDVSSGTVTLEIPVGKEPFGLAVASAGADSGADVVVTDWSADALLRLDAATGKETGRAAVGRSPAHVVVDKRRQLAYVADRESDAVSIVDTERMERLGVVPVGTAPFALALSPDGDALYVGNVRSNDLSVVDTIARRETSRLPAGLMPYGVAVTPDGARVLVTNQQNGGLTVIEPRAPEKMTRARIGVFPEGIALASPSRALVADWAEDEVLIVELPTLQVIERIHVGAGPRGIVMLSA